MKNTSPLASRSQKESEDTSTLVFKYVPELDYPDLSNRDDGLDVTLTRELNSVQKQFSQFLTNAEALMEERIQAFREEEEEKFMELSRKAHNDKNDLINKILEARKSLNAQENIFTDKGESSSHRDCGSQKMSMSIGSSQSDGASAPEKMMNEIHSSELSPDAEGLFDLDLDVPDDSSASIYGDDESKFDVDDVFTDEASANALCSCSVPIPGAGSHWPKNKKRQSFLDTKRTRSPSCEESMAASIKALARSVHGDGTEMFGELPRPRYNVLGNA